MSEIEDLGVTDEEYLAGLAAGIDVLELKRLINWGIPEKLALEVMEITPRIANGTAAPEEIARGLMILTPSFRKKIMEEEGILPT